MAHNKRHNSLEDMEGWIKNHSDKICDDVRRLDTLCKQYVNALRNDKDRLRQEFEAKKNQLERKVEEAKQPDEMQKRKIRELAEVIKKHEGTITSYKDDLAELVEYLKEPDKAHREEIKRLQEKLKEQSQTILASEQSLEKHKREHEKMKNELENLQRQRAMKESAIEALKVQKHELIKKRRFVNHLDGPWVRDHELMEVIQQLRTQKEELNGLKNELEQLRVSFQEKIDEIKFLNYLLERSRKERDEGRRQLEREMYFVNKIMDTMMLIEGMGRADDSNSNPYDEDIVTKIRHIFHEYVVPTNVLHLFHKYNFKVLVQADIERIRCATTNHGDIFGAGLLLGLLSRYENWYPCLLKVLRDPKVQQNHVAEMMENALGRGQALVPITDFTIERLPQVNRTACVQDVLSNTFSLVVRISIPWTRPQTAHQRPNSGQDSVPGSSQLQRPQTTMSITSNGGADSYKYGTGMVGEVYKKYKDTTGDTCPCRACARSLDPKEEWAEFGVLTATHFMRYDPVCRNTTCTVFYDTENISATANMTAVKLKDSKPDEGYCEISCITHDKNLADKLEKMVATWKISRIKAKRSRSVVQEDSETCVLVAHPDGKGKCVSVGEVSTVDSDASKKIVYTAETSEGCCGAPVFLFGNGFFTGQTIHCWKNNEGHNESVNWTERFD